MEMLTLRRPYPTVERGEETAWGGCQGWLREAGLQKCGCGLVAAADLLLYLHRCGGERTTRFFWEHLWGTVRTVLLALAAFLVLSEASWRLLGRFLEAENRNDLAIAGKLAESPWSMAVIVVVLAPFVEEALFRGYIFGNLREVSRAGAYAVSALAFALIHVWQFAAASRDPAYLLLAVQYAVPGLVMAWTYERSGTLWGSILLHSLINGISAARML